MRIDGLMVPAALQIMSAQQQPHRHHSADTQPHPQPYQEQTPMHGHGPVLVMHLVEQMPHAVLLVMVRVAHQMVGILLPKLKSQISVHRVQALQLLVPVRIAGHAQDRQ